ncbi:amino acid ABC transporter permease [Paenibacillus thiaminolyticus]|uniref:Amino acid ABC transporter permease n=1 Tax=Paenibacillus thiaminolyticus TaxID=49283 RepID=A0ABT4FT70_PANTH|nr:amino acid ABC transporter permease [Paenibacillus thiaminolyticus]MCY9537757.1 amino acid ABC transporter permease [Paenibacillus thiaminolyticus]MCY9600314.1 amino acid ABC transporter permease [Paenibacillus thiaminolyticus]MCY9607356.1 amino acid ABC transporter permease [Paenibacillus thiaminolyticus]MCY9613901.1 amino acid ABC transporter permease [Paenibacillus thiaminolyticus]MCY9617906.1 amino acid ABC transporter permease [Paenibacillus thiaminolyticus]
MLIQFNVLTEHLDRYLIGLGGTVAVSVISLFASFILGAVIAVFRITPIKPLQWFGTAYVEFLRNIPLMLIAIFVLVGLPLLTGALLVPFAAGLTALTVYTSAFIAEVIRAGIQAVPAGQMEAARSSGLTYIQALRHVILPQAIKLVIPPLGNQFLNLVKNSSILTVLSASDLMYQADLINSDTFDTFSTYIFAAAFYLLLTIPLSFGIRFLEQKYQTGKGVEA